MPYVRATRSSLPHCVRTGGAGRLVPRAPPTDSTYWVRAPASGAPCVPRTLAPQVRTECSEWSDPGDAVVKLERVECGGHPLDLKKQKKAEVQRCLWGGAFTVHGYVKWPTNGLKFFLCSVQ